MKQSGDAPPVRAMSAAVGLVPPLFVGAVAVAVLGAYGVSIGSSLTYLAYFLLVIALPGRLLWGWVMSRHERANRRHGHLHLGFEDWACGAAVGYVLELPAYVAARALGAPHLYVLVPGVVVAVGAYHAFKPGRRPADEAVARQRMSLPAVASLSLIVAFVVIHIAITAFAGHPLGSGQITDPDEMYQLALVGELRHHFPATYPYVDYPSHLTYQWFVHAHMAASTWITGLEPETVYRRFDPLLLTILTTLGVAMIAARASRRLWAGPLAAAALVLVGSFDVSGAAIAEAAPEERFLQGPILMHSPTLTLAFVLAVPTTVLCLEVVRPRTRVPWSSWLTLLVLMAGLSGAKVTFLPAFFCGFVTVLGVGLVRRTGLRREPLIGAAAILVVVVASGWFLYGGDAQTLGFSPLKSTRFYMGMVGVQEGGLVEELIVTGSILAMWLLPAVGAVGLLRDASTRWDSRVWWLFGASAAGYGATFLLGHGGQSQLYFGRSVAILTAVLSAWGLVVLYREASSRRAYVGAALVALAAGFMLLVVRLVTEDWRKDILFEGSLVDSPVLRVWVNLPVLLILGLLALLLRVVVRDATRGRKRLPLRTIVVFFFGLGLARTLAVLGGHLPVNPDPPAGFDYGTDGRTAAQAVRELSSPEQRVLTNAHCGPARSYGDRECDTRHFWMSALTERRFVVEGWSYTARSGEWTDPFWGDPQLLARNDRLFAQPTEAAAERFVREHEVGWLLADTREPVDVEGLDRLGNVELVRRYGNYAVFRVG